MACFRAPLTAENITKALGSILTRPKVSEGERQARLDACKACDILCSDEDGDFCGAGCGCGIGGSRPVLLRVAKTFGIDADMTLYSEQNGGLCKHPKRHLGKGWKR